MPPTKSKKFSIFVAILILFIGIFVGGFLFIKNRAGSANIGDQVNYLLGKEKSVATQDKNADYDNDGLPDWQEKVYRTDPKKPDTDGDGYLDGEEVASGYDPLKKAPNDALPGTDVNKVRPLPKNLTKALSLRISQSIVEGKIKSFNKTTGQPLTQEELEKEAGLSQVMEETIGQQLAEFVIPYIEDREIKISDKDGKEETRAYLRELDRCLGKMPTRPGSEMQLFIDAMQSNNFSQVDKVRKIYENSYNELKQVSVPPNFIEFHKGALGVFWVTNNIYKAVMNIDQDPLKTTIALMQYRKIMEKTKNLAIELIKEEFKYQ